jgi:hypothetical protein
MRQGVEKGNEAREKRCKKRTGEEETEIQQRKEKNEREGKQRMSCKHFTITLHYRINKKKKIEAAHSKVKHTSFPKPM